MNHPGLSFTESGWVHITNLNCTLSDSVIPGREDRVKLLVTQPLCDEDAKTGTGDAAPLGVGASEERVLGYPLCGSMKFYSRHVESDFGRYSTQVPSPPPEEVESTWNQ